MQSVIVFFTRFIVDITGINNNNVLLQLKFEPWTTLKLNSKLNGGWGSEVRPTYSFSLNVPIILELVYSSGTYQVSYLYLKQMHSPV